jgi:hypothetical protein
MGSIKVDGCSPALQILSLGTGSQQTYHAEHIILTAI